MTVLLFFSIVNVSEAQIISVQPDTTFINPYGAIAMHGFVYIYNSSTDTLYLRWHRINISVYSSWVSSVCDNNACYSSDTDSADFIISPNDSGYIELTVDGYNETGNGLIQVQVYNPLDSLNLNALAIFSIHVSEINSATENKNEMTFKIFPNPASDFISVCTTSNSNLREVEIFDITGKIVLRYFNGNLSSSEKINIENFPSGKYFVELVTDETNCYTSSFIK